MLFQALSLGREVDVWKPQRGVVHSVFDRAVNLLVEGEMWTVLAPGRLDAPFGIRLASNTDAFAVKVSDRLSIRAGFVSVGDMTIDCRTATRWTSTRWAQPTNGFEDRLAIVERVARSRAWTESAGMAGDVTEALHGSDANLARVVQRTVGRGPGLTPAGDDVLVGILTFLTSGADIGDAASRLVGALTPVLPTTTDVSRHLLRQAARGLPGRALHDLGKALIEGAPHDVLTDALDLVLDTGFTSGADACMGLAAACRFSFLNTERLAA